MLMTGAAWIAVGADSLECVVDQVLETLQYTKLNKSVMCVHVSVCACMCACVCIRGFVYMGTSMWGCMCALCM